MYPTMALATVLVAPRLQAGSCTWHVTRVTSVLQTVTLSSEEASRVWKSVQREQG